MTTLRLTLIHLAAAALLTACSGPTADTASVPRRKAYPRIEVPDSSFVAVDSLPLHLQVNRAASASIVRSDAAGRWVDVTYPGLDASIHYTFTPVTEASAPQVIDNRIERIALNLGGNDAEMVSLTNAEGIDSRVFVSRSGVVTPVQFLATDGMTTVVSGVAYIASLSKERADSLAPVIDMLARDVVHSLVTLTH